MRCPRQYMLETTASRSRDSLRWRHILPLQPNNWRTGTPRQAPCSLPAPPGHPSGSPERSCVRSGDPLWRNPSSAKASADGGGVVCVCAMPPPQPAAPRCHFGWFGQSSPFPASQCSQTRGTQCLNNTPKHSTGPTKELNQNHSSTARCNQNRAAIPTRGTAVPTAPSSQRGRRGSQGAAPHPGTTVVIAAAPRAAAPGAAPSQQQFDPGFNVFTCIRFQLP